MNKTHVQYSVMCRLDNYGKLFRGEEIQKKPRMMIFEQKAWNEQECPSWQGK